MMFPMPPSAPLFALLFPPLSFPICSPVSPLRSVVLSRTLQNGTISGIGSIRAALSEQGQTQQHHSCGCQQKMLHSCSQKGFGTILKQESLFPGKTFHDRLRMVVNRGTLGHLPNRRVNRHERSEGP